MSAIGPICFIFPRGYLEQGTTLPRNLNPSSIDFRNYTELYRECVTKRDVFRSASVAGSAFIVLETWGMQGVGLETKSRFLFPGANNENLEMEGALERSVCILPVD